MHRLGDDTVVTVVLCPERAEREFGKRRRESGRTVADGYGLVCDRSRLDNPRHPVGRLPAQGTPASSDRNTAETRNAGRGAREPSPLLSRDLVRADAEDVSVRILEPCARDSVEAHDPVLRLELTHVVLLERHPATP